jgi:hypothetical protein
MVFPVSHQLLLPQVPEGEAGRCGGRAGRDAPELYLYEETSAIGLHSRSDDPATLVIEKLTVEQVEEAIRPSIAWWRPCTSSRISRTRKLPR